MGALMDNDILNNSSITDRVDKLNQKTKIQMDDESIHLAYLIKNIDGIKELIRHDDITGTQESVVKSIRSMTKGEINIKLTEKITKYFKKNGIYLDSEYRDMQITKKYILQYVISFAIISIILLFLSIVWIILCDYEVSLIKTIFMIAGVSGIFSLFMLHS